MKDSTIIFVLTGVLIVLTVFTYIWLWFLIQRPQKWASFVDRENDFLVRKGFISATFADRMKRHEKGLTQKLIVGGDAFLGTGLLIYIGYILFKHGYL